ncbi:ATP-binding protein [Archangium gephyra]|uniref:ATP-binding protein n=1 Tax=Archangium gephyra TaxID=48 RepID=UPI0035D44922
MSPESPLPLSLEDPAPLLQWLSGTGPEPEQLELLSLARTWVRSAIVAASVLDQRAGAIPRRALKLVEQIAIGKNPEARARLFPAGRKWEPARFRPQRVDNFEKIEPFANDISRALIPDTSLEDTRLTLRYVIVELLRNVVQHSHSPGGGVVSADLWEEGGRSMLQLAVADVGIGIPASLRSLHPNLSDPEAALEKSLWPHISGTFEEGLTGTQQNAGMGLFFIAEMAKLTGGTLLIATRGATLLLSGWVDEEGNHSLRFIEPRGIGFPGTLVGFELPVGGVVDYPALIETIKERAKQRTPQRAIHRWVRFDPAPSEATVFEIQKQAENTPAAIQLAQNEITPRILRREPIVLDFSGLRILTQSYLHSLLFEPLRLAWALRTPIYVRNVEPAVRSNLELLENYALAG